MSKEFLSDMTDHKNSKDRIITFGPRQVKFPSPNLGILIDSTKKYETKNFVALRENLERDGYL